MKSLKMFFNTLREEFSKEPVNVKCGFMVCKHNELGECHKREPDEIVIDSDLTCKSYELR